MATLHRLVGEVGVAALGVGAAAAAVVVVAAVVVAALGTIADLPPYPLLCRRPTFPQPKAVRPALAVIPCRFPHTLRLVGRRQRFVTTDRPTLAVAAAAAAGVPGPLAAGGAGLPTVVA